MLERAFTLAALLRELLALGFCYRVGGRSIRQFEPRSVLAFVHYSYFLYLGFAHVRRFAGLRP
jgi:hypothetical protein